MKSFIWFNPWHIIYIINITWSVDRVQRYGGDKVKDMADELYNIKDNYDAVVYLDKSYRDSYSYRIYAG